MASNHAEIYSEFADWLDNLLENNDMPENTQAFNFNLYEESEDEYIYGVQIIASDRFDADDGDWACYEIWSSEEDIFCVSTSDEDDKGWQQFLKFMTEIVCDYLENGKHKDILFNSKGIGIGFVDGEIDIIYKAEDEEDS
ncbi:MAG: hypothetical protein K2O29_08375 [Ruminococcus sp.]|nr:hypothetical protein [Ruminococcus sp.]MDE6849494.1 hypothetical protein [Ruminococcus sp.]MDE7138455.1 hypothetical protein [Ruminococcus sp.]